MAFATVEPAADLFATDGSAYVLDVRTEAERLSALGFIPGSHLVVHTDLVESKDPGSLLPGAPAKDTRIIIFCRGGVRAAKAAAALAEAGYSKCEVVKGGMMAWNEKELPHAVVSVDDVKVAAVSPTGMRDMLVACYLDAEGLEFGSDSDAATAVVALLRRVFEEEAGSWDAPERGAFKDKVLRRLAEEARRAGHDAESIAAHTAEYTALIMKWSEDGAAAAAGAGSS